MNMDVVIRPARKEDCTHIMQLIHELAVYERAPDAVTVDFDHFVESGFGENPVWKALVAELPGAPEFAGASQLPGSSAPGKIIGFALWYIRYSTWKGQRMYLEDLLVSEKMRGQGIGNLLFETLVREGKEKKYSALVWQVLDWNEPALNFYRKFDGVVMERDWLNCSLPLAEE